MESADQRRIMTLEVYQALATLNGAIPLAQSEIAAALSASRLLGTCLL
jgi:hypothetical protein